MILFENVSKEYPDGKIALKEINLQVNDGEFVFLVGSSGAGKTTLLRLLIKEILPSTGTVFFNDYKINILSAQLIPYLRRKIGFIFQDFKLLQDRTVAENIAVSLEILGKKHEEIDKRTREVLGVVGLTGKENYFPKQLSYGEQQRVSIGRVIVGETEVILADEPTGNLDPKTSWEILKILNEINKKGRTVLMATHNVDIVDSMKKRVVMLESGRIIKDIKKGRYV